MLEFKLPMFLYFLALKLFSSLELPYIHLLICHRSTLHKRFFVFFPPEQTEAMTIKEDCGRVCLICV